MNQKEIFQHFCQILDDLINNSDFYKIYFQSCYTLEEDIEINDHLHFCTGISRGCLVDNQYDYVVKFNLADRSLCDKEIRIYENAVRNNVEKFFVEPTYLGTYKKTFKSYLLDDVLETINTWYDEEDFNNKLPKIKENCEKRLITITLELFAYPRAIITDANFTSYTEEDEEYARDSDSPLKEFYLAIAAMFISDYGTEDYNKLTDFLYDWGINDIHFGNVGKINNHICIIDYAGV